MRVFALVVAFAFGGSCGLQEGDKGVGEPCTRDEQCGEGLHCSGGVCHGASDGGEDAG